MTMQEMVQQLNIWAYEYYVLDNPTVSDAEYDALYDRLQALEKSSGNVLFDSPTQRVGGQILKGFSEHKHLKPLYSLDKAQTFAELAEWIGKIEKTCGATKYTVELKYDGLTVSATYVDGKLTTAATRGNGTVGEDVTPQVKTIKSVPLSIPLLGTIEVQGEGIMRKSILHAYNNKNPAMPLKSPRNAAAGAIRNLDTTITAQRNLDVVFYSVGFSDPQIATNQTQLVEKLKQNKFKTNHIFETATCFEQVKAIVEQIEKQRDSYDFLIDGVVIKVDDFALREQLGYTNKFPKWAVAFKFDAEQVVTTLNDVVWQVGRTGKLTPIGNLEPVDLCGATIKRATLNNFGDIERKQLSKHSRVFIRRSNDVIPEVLGLAETTAESKPIDKPTVCPSCGHQLHENGANLFCGNSLYCRPQVIARLTHYCSKAACDIEGISDKTVEVFVDRLDIKTPSQLYNLKYSDFDGIEGYKDKKINNLLNGIEKSKQISLNRLIYALGIENIGVVTAKILAERFGSMDNLRSADIQTLSQIDQVGEVTAQGIVDYFADLTNQQLLGELKNLGIDPTFEAVERLGIFQGKKVVLTGSLANFTRQQASTLVEQNGGQISATVSSSVNLVIAGDDAGSKLDKAKKLAIEVIDEQQFLQMLHGIA